MTLNLLPTLVAEKHEVSGVVTLEEKVQNELDLLGPGPRHPTALPFWLYIAI